MLLALSLVALLIGPFLVGLFPYNRRLDNFLFAFVLVSVGGLLLIDVLPAIWEHISYALIPAVLLGFFGPGLIEVSFRRAADKAHSLAIFLGISGLMIHSLLDGAAIVTNDTNPMLAYAVILHRIVVGLSIWWIVQPQWGNFRTWLVFAFMFVTTVIGFYAGEQQLTGLHNNLIDYFQAFISGTLLHVIIHRPHVDDHGHIHHHDHSVPVSVIHEEAANNHHHSHATTEAHHSHGLVIKHKGYFALGMVLASILLFVLHLIHQH